MSELTQCNYCTLQELKRRRKKGYRITILKAHVPGLGGLNVYVHPKEVKIDPKDLKHKALYWQCWFMALGRRCEC